MAAELEEAVVVAVASFSLWLDDEVVDAEETMACHKGACSNNRTITVDGTRFFVVVEVGGDVVARSKGVRP